MKKSIIWKMWANLLIIVVIMGFTLPGAMAANTVTDKEVLFETVITLLNETSILRDDAIEDYSIREAEQLPDENGDMYWHVSFVKPSRADGESPRNIVFGLSLDGRQAELIGISPSEAELVMERFYKAIHAKGADMFILLPVNDQYDIAQEFLSVWASLPEGTLSADGYLHRTINKAYALPEDGDLSKEAAIQAASEALQASGKGAQLEKYKIAASFLREEDSGSVWQIFFIANNAISDHPGYRVDVKNPEAVAQIVDYGLDKDFFKHGYE